MNMAGRHKPTASPQPKTDVGGVDIVIVQQYPMPYFGVLALDAHLRKAGYRMDVLIKTFEPDIIATLKSLSPRIVGFSVFSTEHNWLVGMTHKARSVLPSVPIIVGGVHAMVYPEQILLDSEADLVCWSDGEGVLINVLQELAGTQPDFTKVSGLALKTPQGGILRTSGAPRVAFDDRILEDRDIYLKRYHILSQDSVGYFMSSRGCPYSCSFCYNSYLREAAGATGYLRRKNPDSLVREIESAVKKCSFISLAFVDDIFSFDKKWLQEFLPQYHEKVNLPFWCNIRADVMDEETARLLAEAGCHSASFGIETGNEELRWTVLNKKISDEQMIRCGTLLHKYGIIVRASSMFCLPDETVDDALRTIELNIQSKVDLPASQLFIPYPKTSIAEYMKKKGIIAADYSLYDVPFNSYNKSVVNIPNKAVIKNVHYLIYFFVKYPWIFNNFKWLIYLTWLSPLYYCLFMYSLIERNKKEKRLTWVQIFIYGWRKKSLLK